MSTFFAAASGDDIYNHSFLEKARLGERSQLSNGKFNEAFFYFLSSLTYREGHYPTRKDMEKKFSSGVFFYLFLAPGTPKKSGRANRCAKEVK